MYKRKNDKITNITIYHTRKKNRDILQIIYSDVCGPIDPVSHNDDVAPPGRIGRRSMNSGYLPEPAKGIDPGH